jgi:hypothetical protein
MSWNSYADEVNVNMSKTLQKLVHEALIVITRSDQGNYSLFILKTQLNWPTS